MKSTKTIIGLIAITAALAVQVQAQSFLTNGLVAYYPFNGNGNDASGYLNNPSLNNASLTTNRFNLANTAYSFTGSQELDYGSQPQIEFTSNLTVSSWVKTATIFSEFKGIVSKATASNPWDGFQIGVSQYNVHVQVDLNDFAGTNVINDGKWHSICVVFNKTAGTLQIFVDSKLDSTFITPLSVLAGQYQLKIGTEREGLNYFTGSIDDVRIYNRALITNEVTQLFAAELQPQTAIVKAVRPSFSSLVVGASYQLQVSGDLNTWTNQGSAFTATNSSMAYPQYWDVPNWNQLFFRLQVAP